MRNNTAIPTIEFGPGTDYDALYTVLFQANAGLYGEEKASEGHGLTWAFHMEDGSIIIGTFKSNGYQGDVDYTVIAVHDHGSPNGEMVAVKTDDIVKLTYL